MTHQEIEKLAKKFIVDSAEREANPRVQEIVLRLVTDLFKAIEDLDMTATEIWKGIEFLWSFWWRFSTSTCGRFSGDTH